MFLYNLYCLCITLPLLQKHIGENGQKAISPFNDLLKAEKVTFRRALIGTLLISLTYLSKKL